MEFSRSPPFPPTQDEHPSGAVEYGIDQPQVMNLKTVKRFTLGWLSRGKGVINDVSLCGKVDHDAQYDGKRITSEYFLGGWGGEGKSVYYAPGYRQH